MKQQIDSIQYQLDNTPLEFKGGAYANYYELMDKFLDSGVARLVQLQEDFENFRQFGTMVLQAFGQLSDDALPILLDYLHRFAKKFRDIAWERRSERIDFARYKQLGLIDENSQKINILDQLIEGISIGDYSIVETASQIEIMEDFETPQIPENPEPPAPAKAPVRESPAPAPAKAPVRESPAPAKAPAPEPEAPAPEPEMNDPPQFPDQNDPEFPPEEFDAPFGDPVLPPEPEQEEPEHVMTVEELLGSHEGGPNVDDLEALLAETEGLVGFDGGLDELLS